MTSHIASPSLGGPVEVVYGEGGQRRDRAEPNRQSTTACDTGASADAAISESVVVNIPDYFTEMVDATTSPEEAETSRDGLRRMQRLTEASRRKVSGR